MYKPNLRGNNWIIAYEDHTGELEEVRVLFDGEIRNYNELKQVMKFVNIQ